MFSLGSGSAPPALSEKDLRNLVNTELIREAGVDYESRPLLVFYSCHLPDPRAADYDFLLDSILTRLDQFVERDYAIVLFSSGSKHQPSWAWMFKAYSRLSRKFRKNLKNLYIVHPSPWAKLLLQMMGTIISPKFTRKVVWVNSLSLLKTHIPLGNIYIPDIIIQANERFEHSSSAPSSPPPPLKINTNPDKKVPGVMFGVDLKVLMGADGSKGIPIVISDTVAYIRANGLDCEGVFRRSPSSQLLKDAKDYYDRGEKGFDFEERGGLHCATVLLKLFFRELPKPIFESDMYDIFRKIEGLGSGREGQVKFIRTTIFPLLTLNELLLLRFVFDLLHTIHESASKNLMNSHNLTIIWAPNLIRGGSPVVDMAMCAVGSGGGGVGTTVKLMIEEYPSVFSDIIESQSTSAELLPTYIAEVSTAPTARPRKNDTNAKNRNSILGEQDEAIDSISKALSDNRLATASKNGLSKTTQAS